MKRSVFYLPGFDPRGAKFYHRLYRDEALRQGDITDTHFTVSARDRVSNHHHHWGVEANSPDGHSYTDYHYLAWDDIVRGYWVRSPVGILLGTLRSIFVYIFSGGIFRGARLNRSTVITLLYPLVFVTFGVIAFAVASIWVGFYSLPFYWWVGLPCIAAIWFLGYPALVKLGEKFNVFWLLQIYMFIDHWVHKGDLKLEQRLDQFANEIKLALNDPAQDEVLLIGHSVGGILMVPLAARLGALGVDASRLRILTLGHCIPLIRELKGATAYAQDMQKASSIEDLVWFDVSSARDGACFFGLSPLYCEESKLVKPLVRCFSARWHTRFSPEKYTTISKDWYRMHFQYLMASESAGLMDYFKITAGAVPVVDVFNGYAQYQLNKAQPHV